MSAREVSTETKALVRAAISNAFYDARNTGRTMEAAADAAVEALVPILLSCDENAHGRGRREAADDLTSDAALVAFKDAWHRADAENTHGSRVRRGMTAVAEVIAP